MDVMIRSLHDDFGLGVWIYDKNEATGEIRVLKMEGAFKWEPYTQGTLLPKPIFTTTTREAEVIFDKFIEQLKEAGYGKDKLSVESGQLKAMREHLDDMKKLVFDPPRHFAPMVIGNATSGISMLAGIREPDEVVVKASRVRTAARSCGTAAEILKEIFPEIFPPGWQNR